MSDQNLYPPDNPKARKKARRAPRPKHLPPYDPSATPAEPTAAAPLDAVAQKRLQVAPASAAFGGKVNNALRFHELQKKPVARALVVDDGTDAGDDEPGR